MRVTRPLSGPRSMRAATVASLCFAAAAFAGAPAGPDGAPHRMTLSGYTDSADGASLLAGEYGVVIGSLAAHGVRFKLDEIAASTNLCVAYIKTHDWSAAHPACDEAIRFAKLEAPDWQAGRASARAEHIAIAYSNRAVLEWLEDRTAAAADDLAKAYALAPQSAPVAQNLAKLGRGDLLGARAPTHGTAATSAATHG